MFRNYRDLRQGSYTNNAHFLSAEAKHSDFYGPSQNSSVQSPFSPLSFSKSSILTPPPSIYYADREQAKMGEHTRQRASLFSLANEFTERKYGQQNIEKIKLTL